MKVALDLLRQSGRKIDVSSVPRSRSLLDAKPLIRQQGWGFFSRNTATNRSARADGPTAENHHSMIPYLIMIALPGSLALAAVRRWFWIILVVALIYWLMIGFRFHVGVDWDNYYYIYRVKSLEPLTDLIFSREPGFNVLNWFAHKSGGGLILVNAVSGLIFTWGLFAVARSCGEPFIAVTSATPLLVVAFAMSGTRQAMALGIIFILYAQWPQRTTLRRIMFVLAAALFHFSAIFVLIFVALATQASLVVRTAGAIAICAFILVIIYFAPGSMETYANLYLSGSRQLTAPGALAHVGALASAALVYFIYRKQWVRANGDNPLYRSLAIASLFAIPAVYISSSGSYRFTLYFWPMAMYVWSGVPAMIDSGTGRALYRLVIVFASVALLIGWLTFANNSPAWLPYQNWLLQPDHASLLRGRLMD